MPDQVFLNDSRIFIGKHAFQPVNAATIFLFPQAFCTPVKCFLLIYHLSQSFKQMITVIFHLPQASYFYLVIFMTV
jgi:hypothetical protein